MPHQPRRDGAFAPSRTFDPWPTVDWSRQVRRKRFGRGEGPVRPMIELQAGRGMPHQPRRDGAFAPSRTFDPWPTADWNRQVRRKRFRRGECPVRPIIERPSPNRTGYAKAASANKPDGLCPINRGGTGHSPRPERLIRGRPLIGTGRFGENVSDGANAPSGP